MTADLAYYNEFDPYAAQWLRNLIDAGHIAPGIVDERSIEDVRPIDLHGFTQCHFFAGIGVWSLALRRARWPDDRQVWTASCPCQPFSQAGEGAGFADERHLWPHLYHLIDQRRPAVVVGEQVASKDADPWLDLVHTDLEVVGYAFGAVAFPSAGIGAPHIRDRTYWVANACRAGLERRDIGTLGNERAPVERGSAVGGLAHAGSAGSPERCRGRNEPSGQSEAGSACGMADSDGRHSSTERQQRGRQQRQQSQDCGGGHSGGVSGPVNGFWRDADWIFCRDEKWRPVEPGTFPLAHGATARVGRLRAYGNAVNAEAARVWIETVMDCLPV